MMPLSTSEKNSLAQKKLSKLRGSPTLCWECTSMSSQFFHVQIGIEYISCVVTLFLNSKAGSMGILPVYSLFVCAWRIWLDSELTSQSLSTVGPFHYTLNFFWSSFPRKPVAPSSFSQNFTRTSTYIVNPWCVQELYWNPFIFSSLFTSVRTI